MSVCGVGTTRPQIEVEYTDSKSCSFAPKSHTLAPEHMTGYPLYPESAGAKTGFYVTQPVETVNLAPNPTFFVNMAGWSTFNARANRTNEFAYDSGFSMRLSGSGDTVTAERREYAEIELDGITPGELYTASMFLWIPQIWDSQDPIMGTISIVDFDGTTFEEVFSEQITKIQSWQRIAVTKRIRDTATDVFVRVNLRSQEQQELTPPFNPTGFFNLQNEYLFADLLQVEHGQETTLPFHGDTEADRYSGTSCKSPFTWLGTPHDSASYRGKNTRSSGRLISLTSLGFEMLSHSGHDAPSVQVLAEKYANKPGSFYQGVAIENRVMTFTGFNCTCTLNELECDLFGLFDQFKPSIDDCGQDEFLLVYHHEDCDDLCDNDRDLAIYVTYGGGFEYTRDSLYRQNIVLQLIAHDPVSWHTWPGHQSRAIDLAQVVPGNRVIKINKLGQGQGFPIEAGSNVTQVACFSGVDRAVYSTDSQLSVIDCGEECPTDLLSAGLGDAQINDLESAPNGDVLVAGDYVAPYGYIARFLSGTQKLRGYGDGYTGGEAFSIWEPPWSQVAVGAVDGVYILLEDDTWVHYQTDGVVLDLITDRSGNLYAVGEFTEIDGVAARFAAKFNVNVNDCFSLDDSVWESLGYRFTEPLNSLAVNNATNEVYIGGEALIAVPDATDACVVVEGVNQQSTGGNQEIQFQQIGTTDEYQVTFRVTNNMFLIELFFCLVNTDNPYYRITASNNIGSSYSLTIGSHNHVNFLDFGFDGTHFVGAVIFNARQDLPDPCADLNQAFAFEINRTNRYVRDLWANVDLVGAGQGLDNRISRFSIQCIDFQETYQAENIQINYVASYNGFTLSALGDGLPQPVTALMFNQDSSELYAGTEAPNSGEGLYTWTDSQWAQFYGRLHGTGSSSVLDMHYCESDCSMYFVTDSDGFSVIAGVTNVKYNGNFETLGSQLIITGEGSLEYLANTGEGCATKQARLCSKVPCDDSASINFSSSQITVGGQSQNNSLLQGSRLDYWLTGDRDNYFNVFMADLSGETKATLLWRDEFWGLNAICCAHRVNGRYLPGGFLGHPATNMIEDSCCQTVLSPTNPDGNCDYSSGTMLISVESNCLGIYIRTNEQCTDICETEDIISDGGGTYLTDGVDGDIICAANSE